jgi:hypothetical protein
MAKRTRFPPEVQERTVRLVQEHRSEYETQWAAITSIDNHAKLHGPEGLLEGHLHCAVLRKRVKYPFCIRRVIDAKQHGETPWPFILLGSRVPAHQNAVADFESCMEDLLAPSRWHLFCHGRLAMCEHKDDLAPKASLIKLERGLALPAKSEIGSQLHVRSSRVSEA